MALRFLGKIFLECETIKRIGDLDQRVSKRISHFNFPNLNVLKEVSGL
jgi:hypothetical protein